MQREGHRTGERLITGQLARALLAGAVLVGLAGCPSRAQPVAVDPDRCPAARRGAPVRGWQLADGPNGWLVCREGRVWYRAPAGAAIPPELVPDDEGELVALVERRLGRCQLLVLQIGEGVPIDPLRFPLAECEPAWRPYWVNRSTITVGPALMKPEIQVQLNRD